MADDLVYQKRDVNEQVARLRSVIPQDLGKLVRIIDAVLIGGDGALDREALLESFEDRVEDFRLHTGELLDLAAEARKLNEQEQEANLNKG